MAVAKKTRKKEEDLPIMPFPVLMLPKIYKNDRSGNFPQHVGKPYISYSQVKTWMETKSFNMRVLGIYEYINAYFLGHDFGDQGWAEFGDDVENYICARTSADKFKPEEKEVLETIKPLGKFQEEFVIDFGSFILIGFIDDIQEDFKKVRDYKTCSRNSSKQYYEQDYYQLDIYALAIKHMKGFVPDIEVCMIEREGNCMFGGGRQSLSVGRNVWYHERHTSEERFEYITNKIRKAAEEIATYYQVFLKINK